MLDPLLESHVPLDLVIIMLGTNDVEPTYRLSASEVAFGCATLVWTVQKSHAGPGGAAPEVLLIAPPKLDGVHLDPAGQRALASESRTLSRRF